jgi:uncharacterized protein (DUF2147 family)
MNKNLILFVVLLTALIDARGQSVLGYWKTIDDVTEKPKSILRIYKSDEGVSARVEEILVEGRKDALCVKCKGPKKDKPIKGMTIFNDLKKVDENTFGEGTILDPESGKEYRVRIWVDPKRPDRLQVRGYIAFFYRTQTWRRVSP